VIARSASRIAGACRISVSSIYLTDGNTEERRGTVSVFNSPPPLIESFETAQEEIAAVGEWLVARGTDGVAPHEVGVFVRSSAQLDRARSALSKAGRMGSGGT
jgi:hypothetical protein